MCTFYSPPADGSDEKEVEWGDVLDSISRGINHIKRTVSRGALNKPTFVIQGDANMQPYALGRGPDPLPLRNTRWDRFLVSHGLRLLNPCMHDGVEHEIRIPYSGKTIKIALGDTHHGIGKSRAIDLIAISDDRPAETTIHNGIHCQAGSICQWEHCVGYARSDHFLASTSLRKRVSDGSLTTAATSFPISWQDRTKWAAGLDDCASVINAFSNLAESLYVEIASKPLGQQASLHAAHWVCDTIAWFQCFIGNVIREYLVHGSSHGPPTNTWLARKRRKVTPPCSKFTSSTADALYTDILSSLQSSGLPGTVIQRCYAFLRPSGPRPLSTMRFEGKWLDEEGTHAAWKKVISNQSLFPNAFYVDFHKEVLHKHGCNYGRAVVGRASGCFDSAITSAEIDAQTTAWDNSPAVPPDLIPRVVYKLEHPAWQSLVRILIMLTGPGALAFRPQRWKYAFLWTKHKKKSAYDIENFRRLWIRVQMGLLQEAVLAARIKPSICRALVAGQSGYVRDVADPHLILHELMATALQLGRPIFLVLGDFQQAFPNTWREVLLMLLQQNVHVDGGAYLLLHAMLTEDLVLLAFSGTSIIRVLQGIPEGGVIGPLLYNCLPDSLLRMLEGNHCGISTSFCIPACWSHMEWSGHGTPVDKAVSWLTDCIRANTALPDVDTLLLSPNLEASALRAMDLCDTLRTHTLIHADDPVFLSSSLGEMQRMMHIVANWSHAYKASFHVGSDKTVAMCVGGLASQLCRSGILCLTFPCLSAGPTPLAWVEQKRWLGRMLVQDGQLLTDLNIRTQLACNNFAHLLGLVHARIMPLPAALRVFEAKVDGTLAPGRWLYAITPQAESRLNSLSDAWARALIGADAWRNAAVAHFVIGWRRSGYGRAIEAIARRRARLWLLPPSDFYKGFFVRAHSLPGNTWAKQSLELLRNWNISDFPENARSDKSYRQYCSYVRVTIISRCSQCWQPLLSKHAYPMTLVDAEAANTTITNVLRGFWMESNLATLFNARAYCRTLASVIVFLPKRTRSMRASAHKCPFCDVFFQGCVRTRSVSSCHVCNTTLGLY